MILRVTSPGLTDGARCDVARTAASGALRTGPVLRGQRLGGPLKFYHRAAA